MWFNTSRLLLTVLLLLPLLVHASKFDIYNDFDDQEEVSVGEYERLSGDSLLWGPYRSSLYFGVRPRIPRSLLSGLMWFNVDSYQGVGQVRHFYEQFDNMKKANWVNYNPRYGGRQIIEDNDCHVRIIIDFVKSNDGKSWGVKIKSKPHKGYENTKISFVWYSGLETDKPMEPVPGIDADDSENGYFTMETPKDIHGYSGIMKFAGLSESLGLFEMEVNDGPKSNKHPERLFLDPELDPAKSHHISLRIPNDNIWRAKDIFMTVIQDCIKDLSERYSDVNDIPPQQAFILRDLLKFLGNLHIVQKIYEGSCEFDVIYNNAVTPQHDKITFENIATKITTVLESNNQKFKTHFPLVQPFHQIKYQKFAKEMLSGLLGGLSYSYGDQLVDRDTIFDEESFEEYELNGSVEGPDELFTLVPSRPFFPRGFYWDEGFHLLPLLKYDLDLALEIIKSWFERVDENGWIAREQILGPELRSRVPEKFQTQSPEIVNPPTIMMALSYILENLGTDVEFGDLEEPKEVKEYSNDALGLIYLDNPTLLFNYTKELYPKFKSHFEMFRRTQKGYVEDFDRDGISEAYRWRGRTITHCLASGLDDYPRPLPADIAELNVDLLSWVGVMTKSMKLMAKILGENEDLADFEKIEEEIIENLELIHWSENEKTYCDVSVDENDENMHYCFKGYISLFPFITKLIPTTQVDKIEHIVDMLKDPEQLWSPYGIRSLSKSDEKYRTAENYWRSPIWLNINYLVLEALVHYKQESAPHMSSDVAEKLALAYSELRVNLVENVYSQWDKTGFVWEQYDDITGEAKGAKNFLGWTSTVLLIMKMPTDI